MRTERMPPPLSGIPERVRDLIASREYPTAEEVSQLKRSDIRLLRQIARGDTLPTETTTRLKALLVMAHWGGKLERRVLLKVVLEENERREVRAAAATYLSHLPPRKAERRLIAALKVTDDFVLSNVIKSLGRIGGRSGYAALNEMAEPGTDFVRKNHVLARTLIAYRLGLDDETLSFVEGAERKPGPDDELLEISIKQVGATQIHEGLERLEDRSFGIEIAQDTGFEVSVGRAKWLLFLNQRSVEMGLLSSLASQTMIVGLLARWLESDAWYSIQYIVLTRPTSSSKIQLMVVRTDGEIFYSGRADFEKGIMNFSVSDVERPGTAPTLVSGRFGPEGVELELALPFGKRKEKRQTQKLSADYFRT